MATLLRKFLEREKPKELYSKTSELNFGASSIQKFLTNFHQGLTPQ